ncbi:hypothetical protein WA158_003957 [Blastocystis sp. Blastoise]
MLRIHSCVPMIQLMNMRIAMRAFASAAKTTEVVNPNLVSPFDAIKKIKEKATAKFDESIDIAMNLNVNPTKQNQNIRGVIMLPNAVRARPKIAVFTSEDRVKEALDAGATMAGLNDIIQQVKDGKIDFDIAVATPDVMSKLGPIAKILGPRKLMPNAKVGTISTDIKATIADCLKGRVEIKVDKCGTVHACFAKRSFTEDQIIENLKTFLIKVYSFKPETVKKYVDSVYISATMGPSFELDLKYINPSSKTFFKQIN